MHIQTNFWRYFIRYLVKVVIIGKNTEGVIQLNFDKKANLDFDKKMHNYVLKKKRKTLAEQISL